MAAQEGLRVKLWPNDQAEPDHTATEHATAQHATAQHATAERASSDAPPRAAPDDRPLLGAHLSNLPLTPPAPSRRNSPIPGHRLDDDRYAWYAVADRQGSFLPSIPTGIWLLADRELDDLATGQNVVIVSSRQPGLGSISLRSFDQASLTYSLYLGVRTSGGPTVSDGPIAPDGPIALDGPIASAGSAAPHSPMPQLFLDDGGHPVSGSDVQVLGVVKGFWQILNGPPAGDLVKLAVKQ
jgi:hypothetical protein